MSRAGGLVTKLLNEFVPFSETARGLATHCKVRSSLGSIQVGFGLLLLLIAGSPSTALADTSDCNTLNPPPPISENSAAPTEDVISITVSETVVDVDVSVNLTHDYIDDVELDIISPAGTVVRLHDRTGTADFIIVSFDDQGVPNGSVEFDSGCAVQPSGPGTLSNFAGEDTAGDWTIRAFDSFPGGATGFISEWCLSTYNSAVSSPVLPVTNLACSSTSGTGVIDVTWSNPQTYSAIDVISGGTVLTSLPGTATSFSSGQLPFGVPAEFCVQPQILGAIPCFSPCVSMTPQSTPADVEACQVSALVVSNNLPPTLDTIDITDDIVIADLQVQVDITHPFLGDLAIDLSHGPVTVRLHDEDGGPQTRIQTTFWDLGIPNGQGSFDCGCLMQPPPPGNLSSFFGLSTIGAWTLRVEDVWTGPINIGELASWCIRAFETGSVNQLDCQTTSGSDVAVVSWVNPQPFDSINVFVNGVQETTLPGTATTYTTLNQTIPSTATICLEPILAGSALPQNCCEAEFFVDPVVIDDCTSTSGSGEAQLTWANPITYDSINIYLNGQILTTLGGTDTSYLATGIATTPLTVAEFCLEGIQNNAPADQVCCSVPVLPIADLEVCRIPPTPVPVNQSVSPITDVMLVPSTLLIGELEVLIDIQHTFVGDLIVDLSGPNGAGVRLHDEQGNDEDDLVALFSDNGSPNAAPYDCGCVMQPSGPGMLADFNNIAALGAWVLRIEDTFPGNTGFIDKWCLRATAGCQILPPANPVCSSTGTEILVEWTNPVSYDSIEIERGGAIIATLPGTATSYLDLSPAPGEQTYRVLGVDVAQGCANGSVEAFGGSGITDLIYSGDSGGTNDSPALLAQALATGGRFPMVVENFDAAALDAVGTFDLIWICLGTYPNEAELSSTEAFFLAELHTGDIGLNGTIENDPKPVYIESADHWAFDPPTTFEDYDGVENFSFGNLQNGNDSLTDLVGLDTGLGVDLTNLDSTYLQDSGANDYSDRIVPCNVNPDLGGNGAAVTWTSDEFGNIYSVGVFYASTIAPVLTQTWEFGGYQGDPFNLVSVYVNALSSTPPPPTDQFIRGDTNDDGSVNVGDVIFLLNSLFVTGSPQLNCLRAGDVNDDETTNVADAIFFLNALFVLNSPPVPPPNVATGCGSDPTPGTQECLTTQNCP